MAPASEVTAVATVVKRALEVVPWEPAAVGMAVAAEMAVVTAQECEDSEAAAAVALVKAAVGTAAEVVVVTVAALVTVASEEVEATEMVADTTATAR